KFIYFNLPSVIEKVREMHCGGARIDRRDQLVPCLHLNQLDAILANLMVEWVAMALLDDHLGLGHARQVGNLLNVLLVVASKNRSIAYQQRRRRSTRYQARVSVGHAAQ